MPASASPPWRYGVALFPVPPLVSLLALGGLWAFVSMSASEPVTEAGVLVGIATFGLTVLSNWLAVLVAAVVAVCTYLDARSLAGHGAWSPNRYAYGGVGLVHLAATDLLFLNLVSVPAFLYYVHQRRQHVS